MTIEMRHKHIPEAINRLMPRSPCDLSNAAMTAKVTEEIRFLKDRIERIKSQPAPNTTVLKTYQSMLESREVVLKWLHENSELDAEVSASSPRNKASQHSHP